MTTFWLKMGRWQTDGTADLWAGRVVVRRLQPAEGMRAASRLAAGPNLWPRHLLLFMR